MLFALPVHAAELEGVTFEDRVRVDGRELELNGIGMQRQIDALFAMIRSIRQAKKGMRIVLDYALSARATTLFVDGVAQGPAMLGEEYFRILLRIWFGDYPAQEELKRALLGQQL